MATSTALNNLGAVMVEVRKMIINDQRSLARSTV